MVAEGFPDKHNFLVIIAGPTAVGKTGVAIDVARHFNTDVISADSRQFYRGMSIGTAAPSAAQLALVKHHFVGHLDPEDYFNVSKYEESVLTLLEQHYKEKNIAVLTGGSGFYVQAVTNGIDDLPDADEEVRNQLQKTYETGGLSELRRLLLTYDPVYAAKVDMANPVRIMRALEVTLQTGSPYSSFLRNESAHRDFVPIKIALNISRELLHQRINQRVDAMIEEGLEEEARYFYPRRHLNSLNTVGYKELFEYFDGKVTFNEAVDKIKTNTRRYARRQITWLKRDKEYVWLKPDSREVVEYIAGKISMYQ